MATTAPYGSWESPITLELLTGGGLVGLGAVDASEHGIYWTESRPHEQGRTALVFRPHGGETGDVVPQGFNARSRANEYGDRLYLTSGAPASSAPVLQPPQDTLSPPDVDSLPLNA